MAFSGFVDQDHEGLGKNSERKFLQAPFERHGDRESEVLWLHTAEFRFETRSGWLRVLGQSVVAVTFAFNK